MRLKPYHFLIVGVVLSPIAGCHSVSVEQLAPPVDRITVDPSNVGQYQRGREIYVGRCAKCHAVKAVNAYAAQDWASRIMPKMAKNAKLTPEEKETVLAYVLAARESAPGMSMH